MTNLNNINLKEFYQNFTDLKNNKLLYPGIFMLNNIKEVLQLIKDEKYHKEKRINLNRNFWHVYHIAEDKGSQKFMEIIGLEIKKGLNDYLKEVYYLCLPDNFQMERIDIALKHIDDLLELYEDKKWNYNFSEIIKDKLYLGNEDASRNLKRLQMNKIKTILVIGNDLKKHHPNKFKYWEWNLFDVPSENIKKHFDDIYNIIENSKGAIFIHCQAGVSRSASVVISYLMKKKKLCYDEAFEFVSKRRNIIHPNRGFSHQLKEYEKELINN